MPSLVIIQIAPFTDTDRIADGSFGIYTVPVLTSAFTQYGYLGTCGNSTSQPRNKYAKFVDGVLSWYSTTSNNDQHNAEGVKYCYIAIG